MTHHTEHRLDKRSRLLADAIRRRIDLLKLMLAPGGIPPWTEARTRREALAFWHKHRFDDTGVKILARYTPDQIASLDLALSHDYEVEPANPAEEGEP